MCDCYAGSLLVAFDKKDSNAGAAFERTLQRYEPQELRAQVGPEAARTLEDLRNYYFQMYVPPGREAALADEFRRQYLLVSIDRGAALDDLRVLLSTPELLPIAQAEAVATAGGSSGGGGAGSSAALKLTSDHAAALRALHLSPATGGYRCRVGLLDSGWDPSCGLGVTPNLQVDLTTDPPGSAATDAYGHGTVVAALVHESAPGCELNVYKVGSKVTREWDFLRGLATAAGECDVINASLGFGLKDRSCSACGRDFGSTRSFVFERLLGELLANHSSLVYVGAAGNQHTDRPVYPARYNTAVCVASFDGVDNLSTFSNYGAWDQDDQPHPCLVLAPGGDRADQGVGADVHLAQFAGHDWNGTSFAAAYVTGIIAAHLIAHGTRLRSDLIADLLAAGDTGAIRSYDPVLHGGGLAQAF
jgi:hypothetical protein